MPSQDIKELLGIKLVLLARLYRRSLDVALKEFGLSEATALPLRHLAGKTDGVRQGALAELLVLEGPSLVQMLDNLEARGLVARQEDPTDRRAKIVVLTEKGEDTHARFMTVLAKLRNSVFDGIADDELDIALGVMSRMETRLRQPSANCVELDPSG